MPLTDVQQAQLGASQVDRKYFFRKFYYIPVVGKGATLFDLRGYQEDICDVLDGTDLVIGLKARQIGWTTIGMAYVLHDVLFNQEHPWLLVSRNEDAAMKMLDKAKYAYFRLPQWMREVLPRLVSYTQTSMTFDNGSRIESVPATGSTGRGDSVFGALLDECAFMEYAEDIWGAVEPLVYGKAMIFSTANGMGNFFHEIWLDSYAPDTVWEGIFFPWDVVPTRSEAWYEHTRLAYRGREWLFYQEYPSTPEEAFAKSGRVAFTSDLIQECYVEQEPVQRLEWIPGKGIGRELLGPDWADIELTFWELPTVRRDEIGRPVYKPNYVVGADIAEGLEHGDFTYITVFDANLGEQVMSCKSSIPIAYLDELLEWLGYYYMRALIIPERNNAGVMPAELLLHKRMYRRLYRMAKFAELASGNDIRQLRYGWITSPQTKPKMVNDFILALASAEVTLHDPEFVREAQTFVADGKGSYAATSNNHDDVIMGTLVTWQGVIDVGRFPIQWQDDTTQPATHDEIDKLFFSSPTDDFDIMEHPIGRDRDFDRGVKKSWVQL